MLLVNEKVYSTIKSVKSDETIRTDVFQMNEEKVIKLKFLSSSSPRNQGICFISENGITMNDAAKQKTIIIWKSEILSDLILKCSSGFLNVFNVWEEERMVGFHDFQSGMRIKKENDELIYSCNDAFANGDFTSLVFSLQIV